MKYDILTENRVVLTENDARISQENIMSEHNDIILIEIVNHSDPSYHVKVHYNTSGKLLLAHN